MKTTTIGALATMLALSSAAASAQQNAPKSQGGPPLDDKVFVSVNVGVQTTSSTISNDFNFPIYRETATSTMTANVGKGAIFDISGGYRITPRIGVAVGFTAFGDTGTAQGTASIPNPVFFNRPAVVTIVPTETKRSDRTTYVVLAGFLPIAEKTDLSVFIGPAFTHVGQDLIYDVSVVPGTQSVLTPIRNESGTATGVNVGADVSYQVHRQVGVGGFMRYISGSVDLPSASGVKAGGFQLGIGARLHF